MQWTVTFNTDGRYQWNYSDKDGVGSYTCSGLSIEANGTKVATNRAAAC